MASKGTYYLGRIIKAGLLDKEILIKSLYKPKPITVGTYLWTITDFTKLDVAEEVYFGKLSKFESEGNVKVIDRETNKEKSISEPDLIKVSSPFLYIPEYSGIAFLHVWNEIQKETFVSRFRNIVIETCDDFFVDFKIEPIAELKNFFEKLSGMTSVNLIYAKVNPPNPFFGHLWGPLEKYLKSRKADELKIEEKSYDKDLRSLLISFIQKIINKEDLTEIDPESIGISDAAILMAIDGYGNGKIEGKANGKKVVIKTSDKVISFQDYKEPDPTDLFVKTKEKLESIKKERYMKHNE